MPLSGLAVTLRPPTGAEDLLLAEAGATMPRCAAAGRAAGRRRGRTSTGARCAVIDLDALVLRLRQALIGDRVSRRRLRRARCGGRIDMSFSIDDYLAPSPAAPRPPKGAAGAVRRPDDARLVPAERAGRRRNARFRLPTLTT